MQILTETPTESDSVAGLIEEAFGPDRFTKTVYRFRDGIDPVWNLCLVAREGGAIRGSIRFWPVVIGPTRATALLLGPLAVRSADRGRGYGRMLMWAGLDRAKHSGHERIVLVGDASYYGQFGFTRGPTQNLSLPGPVELPRFLGLALVDRAFDGVSGEVMQATQGAFGALGAQRALASSVSG